MPVETINAHPHYLPFSTDIAPHDPELYEIFRNPPPEAKPGIYWYWMNGNVTRSGISADLESMRAAGISTVMLFSIGGAGPETIIDSPAQSLTENWWDLVVFATQEAERLGLKLSMNACDGWATASGPWITPELSMKRLAWSETVVEGPHRLQTPIPEPETLAGFYRDLQVYAFPRPAEWDQTSISHRPDVSGSLPISSVSDLLDPANNRTVVDSVISGDIVFDFNAPFLLRSVTVTTPPVDLHFPGTQRAANSLEIEASDDGVTYRHVGALEYPRQGWQTDLESLTHAIPETRARFFRFAYVPAHPGPYREDQHHGQDTRLRINSIVLSGRPMIHHLPIKSAETWGRSRRMTEQDISDQACVQQSQIINLTDRLSHEGLIDWAPPAGRWTVLRIGYTSTGQANARAGNGQGLECDKLSKSAVRVQFDKWFGEAQRRTGPEIAGKVLNTLHVDSWEARSQNWSSNFPDEFRQRRGYDVLPWLPVMAGIPIRSAEQSERILFDLRLSISDLVADNFFGELRVLAQSHGCGFSAEVANPTFPVDGLQFARDVDIPMGEFWLRTPQNYKPTDIKEAVSAARIYNRKIAGSEAFTQLHIRWDETPWLLKPLGDHHFAEGINRFYLHVWAMQPWKDRAPGMTLGGVGSFFGRTQTWWAPGKAWIAYLARNQALLQQGHAVVDLAMFTGEDIPARAVLPEDLPVPLPVGYAYDSINRDALMHGAQVVNGRLTLPGNASYAALLLPRGRRMTPELAERLAHFSEEGLLVIGETPQHSWSGIFGENADQQVNNLGKRMNLSPYPEKLSIDHTLIEHNIFPDLLMEEAKQSLEWTHRKTENSDIYFLFNPVSTAFSGVIDARAVGSVEIWDADSETRSPVASKCEAGRTRFHIDLAGYASVFIILSESRPAGGINVSCDFASSSGAISDRRKPSSPLEILPHQSANLDSRRTTYRSGILGEAAEPVSSAMSKGYKLEHGWRISFNGELERPTDLGFWINSSEDRVRYFSGTATYTTEFVMPDGHLKYKWWLDLGDVGDLAEVFLNGTLLRTLWKPPFTTLAQDAIVVGHNRLVIKVTNTWHNNLVGNAGHLNEPGKPFVWPLKNLRGQEWLPKASEQLVKSGLAGPVRLIPEAT